MCCYCMKQLRRVCITYIHYKILSSRYTFFLAGHGYHGMKGITSTAATATNDNFVYGMISSWSQNPGSSNYWYDQVWHNKVSFLQNLTVLRGVICRVRGVICREKGVICRNCETNDFQFCHSRFFRYHRGDKTWAHATHIIKLRDPVLIFVDTATMSPPSPVFGFMGCLVLSSFALFNTIQATCSYHNGMSCRLFSGWFGASSRHKQYPTVVALESQLGIKLLRYDSGMIFQGHCSCSRKLPGAFFILRGGNFVPFAKRQKNSTGGCCRYIYSLYRHLGTVSIVIRPMAMGYMVPWSQLPLRRYSIRL